MVKAELIHNPYLLITTVKFNGHSPKINCQIEKYEHQPLKNWVKKVPEIFFDEMNGYDFELYFTGTKPDYNEVKAAFESVGVTQEQVQLFHKKEIEDSITKSAEINALFEWLRHNPNRRFDSDEFWEINKETFEVSYPLIVIGGTAPESMALSISPESVYSATELVNTNLSSTPIVLCIEEANRKQFRTDLDLLLKREDVHQNQLFFMVDPGMELSQISRVIFDLGVAEPQIINCFDDSAVLAFVKNYPITEYVRNVIGIISVLTEHIGKILEKENQESVISNAEIHQEIEKLRTEIERLKNVDERIIQRDNYNASQQFEIARKGLFDQLLKWKNRKTKIVGDHDAVAAAGDYSVYINKAWNNFFERIVSIKDESLQSIGTLFSDIYAQAEIDTGYEPEGVISDDILHQKLSDLTLDFLELKDFSVEEAKPDFFGIFRKTNENHDDPATIVTYFLEKWRSKAIELIMPMADTVISDCLMLLSDYYNDLAQNYHEHLADLISVRTKSKDTASVQLSDDEKKLQEDNDWLAYVKEKLQLIERG